jgi:hypothetical protein
LSLEAEIVEQNLPQVLDVARVVRRFAIVDQRRCRFVHPEGTRVLLAAQCHVADDVLGVGGIGGDFMLTN